MRTFTAVSAMAFMVGILPASPIYAADLYKGGSTKDAPVVTTVAPLWTGFYLGVNGGYAQDGASRDATVTSAYPGGSYSETFTAAGSKASGFVAGGDIGYRYQTGNFVFGVSLDFDGANITGDQTGLSIVTDNLGNNVGSVQVASHQQLDYFMLANGSVGFATGPFLFFAEGGLAVGKVTDSLAFGATSPLVISRSAFDNGWDIGGGVAYQITPNIEFQVKYNYIDFGSYALNGVAHNGATLTASTREDFSIIRAALNYKVGNAYVPLK